MNDVTLKKRKTKYQEKAEGLLAKMSLKQKLNQLSGDLFVLTSLSKILVHYNETLFPSGEDKALGLEPLLFVDGPRGVVYGQSTCFPVSMARGASWDTELETRIGDAIGVEVRSHGANYYGGVCINLLRHPAWGRAQETYGEDSYLLGEFGTSLMQGVQRHSMACVKHFAVNSIENSRFKVDVKIDERTLREVYLPHFKKCVDGGAASIMSAYNKVNGEWASHSDHLLNNILRKEWGFEGFVLSDFVFAVRNGGKAFNAGLDIEMPYKMHFGLPLKWALWRGKSSLKDLDKSVKRILATKLEFKNVGENDRYHKNAILSDAHGKLALECAQKAIVLLKNESKSDDAANAILPINKNESANIAIVGALAKLDNIGDRGSSRVITPSVVTAFQGITDICKESRITLTYHDGKDIDDACKLAKEADYVLVCAGFTHKDEGEYLVAFGGDRDELSLRAHDEALINRLSEVNSQLVVSMFGGSAIITENWKDNAAAILMAWYPGMQGGTALAQIIFGDVNPSGKLPCSFPKNSEDLPYFSKSDSTIHYEYLQGYRHLEHFNHTPAFPFGFGLSYSEYGYSDLAIKNTSVTSNDTLEVRVVLENMSAVNGEEITQLYIGYPQTIERANKDLKGFKRSILNSGEKKTLNFEVPISELRYYDESQKCWVDELGDYQVFIGSSSQSSDLLVASFSIQ